MNNELLEQFTNYRSDRLFKMAENYQKKDIRLERINIHILRGMLKRCGYLIAKKEGATNLKDYEILEYIKRACDETDVDYILVRAHIPMAKFYIYMSRYLVPPILLFVTYKIFFGG